MVGRDKWGVVHSLTATRLNNRNDDWLYNYTCGASSGAGGGQITYDHLVTCVRCTAKAVPPLPLRPSDIEGWDAARLLGEWAVRHRHNENSPTSGEIHLIEMRCALAYNCRPWELLDRGIVASSWTDDHGVVHDGRLTHRCTTAKGYVGMPERDKTAKEITCVECIGLTVRGPAWTHGA